LTVPIPLVPQTPTVRHNMDSPIIYV
jgi:hypothetical protein